MVVQTIVLVLLKLDLGVLFAIHLNFLLLFDFAVAAVTPHFGIQFLVYQPVKFVQADVNVLFLLLKPLVCLLSHHLEINWVSLSIFDVVQNLYLSLIIKFVPQVSGDWL